MLDDAGKLLLRVSVGILMLFHGIAKVSGGVQRIVEMVTATGLPGVFGYLVYVGEVVSPLLVIIGLWTRPAALVMGINMIVAVGLVHTAELFLLAPTGGWKLELQGMFLFGSLSIALLGAGRFSAGGGKGKWN
jgi:putative oxidoreductase